MGNLCSIPRCHRPRSIMWLGKGICDRCLARWGKYKLCFRCAFGQAHKVDQCVMKLSTQLSDEPEMEEE